MHRGLEKSAFPFLSHSVGIVDKSPRKDRERPHHTHLPSYAKVVCGERRKKREGGGGALSVCRDSLSSFLIPVSLGSGRECVKYSYNTSEYIDLLCWLDKHLLDLGLPQSG